MMNKIPFFSFFFFNITIMENNYRLSIGIKRTYFLQNQGRRMYRVVFFMLFIVGTEQSSNKKIFRMYGLIRELI